MVDLCRCLTRLSDRGVIDRTISPQHNDIRLEISTAELFPLGRIARADSAAPAVRQWPAWNPDFRRAEAL